MRLLAIATVGFLTAGSALGFDPEGVEIIGLHLGMSESEVMSRLTSQGFDAKQTGEAIVAQTMDGRLQITLTPEHTVSAIRYVFRARGVGAPAKIREAVSMRFGEPNQAKPPTWCLKPDPGGICSPDKAFLTFDPESLTLLLRVQAVQPH